MKTMKQTVIFLAIALTAGAALANPYVILPDGRRVEGTAIRATATGDINLTTPQGIRTIPKGQYVKAVADEPAEYRQALAAEKAKQYPQAEKLLSDIVTKYRGLTWDVEASKALNVRHKPCVIISASGMMEAGRVKHHIANHIDNPATTILCVGYCEPSTLGAKIMRGDEEVSIFGHRHKVRAELRRIESLSGHGDYNEMMRYIGCQEQKKLKGLFLVHGEAETQEHFRDTLTAAGWKHIQIPDFRDTVEL